MLLVWSSQVLTGVAAAAEYESDQLEGRAAESRANHHEREGIQGEGCEAEGRPLNAAHHIPLV